MEITIKGSIKDEMFRRMLSFILNEPALKEVTDYDFSLKDCRCAEEPAKEIDCQLIQHAQSIHVLELSMRSYNGLKAAGIYMLGDLAAACENTILKIPNIGRLSLREIRNAMNANEIHFMCPHPEWNLTPGLEMRFKFLIGILNDLNKEHDCEEIENVKKLLANIQKEIKKLNYTVEPF